LGSASRVPRLRGEAPPRTRERRGRLLPWHATCSYNTAIGAGLLVR